MSYFPSGFWSRLLTRILADDSVVEIVRNYFIIPEEMQQPGGPDGGLSRVFVDHKPEWVCWQTGLELRYLETTLFSLKQVLQKVVSRFDYHEMKVVIRQDLDRDWSQIELSSILEVNKFILYIAAIFLFSF